MWLLLMRLGARFAIRALLLTIFVITSLALSAILLLQIALSASSNDVTAPILVTQRFFAASDQGLAQGVFRSVNLHLPERDPACLLGLSSSANGNAPITVDDRLTITGATSDGGSIRWSRDFRGANGVVVELTAPMIPEFNGSVTTLTFEFEDAEPPNYGNSAVYVLPCVNHAGLASGGVVAGFTLPIEPIEPVFTGPDVVANAETVPFTTAAAEEVHDTRGSATQPTTAAPVASEGGPLGATSGIYEDAGPAGAFETPVTESGMPLTLRVAVAAATFAGIAAFFLFNRSRRRNEMPPVAAVAAAPVAVWSGEIQIDDYENLAQHTFVIDERELPVSIALEPLRVVRPDDPEAVMLLTLESGRDRRLQRHDLAAGLDAIDIWVDGVGVPVVTPFEATPAIDADEPDWPEAEHDQGGFDWESLLQPRVA